MPNPLRWRSWRRHPFMMFAVVAALALALAAAERARASRQTARVTPGAGAMWIWAAGEGLEREPVPAVFLAVTNVTLSPVPAGMPTSAVLSIAADEQYQLYVNGRWIGSDTLRPKASFNAYEIAPYLHAGPNRVVVELTSRRGAGGLIAALQVPGEATPRLVTGDHWRVVRQATADVYRAGGWTTASEAPVVWEAPPTGRWRLGPAVQRPTLVPPHGEPRVLRARRLRCSGSTCRCVEVGCRWQRIGRNVEILPSATVSDITIFDWGREVVGYPVLYLDPASSARALVATGNDATALHDQPQELLLPMAGATFWHSARPRRFRYLRVYGRALAQPARVVALDDEKAAQLLKPPVTWPGAFGLTAIDNGPDPIVRSIVHHVQGLTDDAPAPGDVVPSVGDG